MRKNLIRVDRNRYSFLSYDETEFVDFDDTHADTDSSKSLEECHDDKCQTIIFK